MDQATDIIQYSAQIGRLDYISALLACIAILMVFSGIVGFLNIRSKAISIARETAHEETEKQVNI